VPFAGKMADAGIKDADIPGSDGGYNENILRDLLGRYHVNSFLRSKLQRLDFLDGEAQFLFSMAGHMARSSKGNP